MNAWNFSKSIAIVFENIKLYLYSIYTKQWVFWLLILFRFSFTESFSCSHQLRFDLLLNGRQWRIVLCIMSTFGVQMNTRRVPLIFEIYSRHKKQKVVYYIPDILGAPKMPGIWIWDPGLKLVKFVYQEMS
jgi:hypothetical protein